MASVGLLSTADRAARDRLRSEFAPQVVEQSPRRRVALLAAVREAAQSDRTAETISGPKGPRDEYAAYLVWVAGDLFHAGYKSSLDLYDAGEAIVRQSWRRKLPQADDGEIEFADHHGEPQAERHHPAVGEDLERAEGGGGAEKAPLPPIDRGEQEDAGRKYHQRPEMRIVAQNRLHLSPNAVRRWYAG
jgi:hypothetical protein